jgi:hypothetical protein
MTNISHDCLICFESFQTDNTYECPNKDCNIYICEGCLKTWDTMYTELECPLCHSSRKNHDIENQTQEVRASERTIQRRTTRRNSNQRNSIYPAETIGMSSRGRMLFIVTSRDRGGPTFLDNYLDYISNGHINRGIKCFKTIICIFTGIFITILLGSLLSNIIYLAEYDGSIEQIINETKVYYTEPHYYLVLSINGVCLLIASCFLLGCIYNCVEKCR